jgi:hypothetical protein
VSTGCRWRRIRLRLSPALLQRVCCAAGGTVGAHRAHLEHVLHRAHAVTGDLGDVQQPTPVAVLQLHKRAKRRDGAHDAAHDLAHVHATVRGGGKHGHLRAAGHRIPRRQAPTCAVCDSIQRIARTTAAQGGRWLTQRVCGARLVPPVC